MTRKLIGIGLLLAFFIGLSFVILKTDHLQPKKHPIESILPEFPIGVLRINRPIEFWKKLSGTNILWEKLGKNPSIEPIHKALMNIDSNFLSNPQLQSILKNKTLFISWYNSPSGTNILVSFEKSNRHLASELIHASKGKLRVKDIEIQNTAMLYGTFGSSNIYLLEKSGYIHLSNTADLFPQLINSEVKNTSSTFLKAMNSCSPFSEASIVFQPSQFHLPFKGKSDWISWDLITSPRSIGGSGLLWSNQFITSSSAPSGFDFKEMIPKEATNFTYHSKDFDQNKSHTLSSLLFEEEGDSLTTGNACSFNFNGSSFYLFELNLAFDPIRLFDNLYKTALDFDTTFTELEFESSKIYKSTHLFKKISDDLSFKNVESILLYDKFLLLAENQDAALQILHEIENGNTLDKSARFDQFTTDHFSKNADYFHFNHSSNSEIDSKNPFGQLLQQQTNGEFGLQLIHQDSNVFFSNFYYNLPHQQDSKSSDKNAIVWQYSLPKSILSGPHTIFNHRTGLNNVLFQLEDNMLVLLDSKGNQLWEYKVDHPIIGAVNQIDSYQNNKLQILFNTQSKLHLIDIKGRNVGSYPINLPSKATTSVAVIDYDKNKNYRLLLPCENNTVYNFDTEGKLVAGWKNPKSKDQIHQPLEHFLIGGKDYIFTIDQSGNTYYFNRKGEERYQGASIPNSAQFLSFHKNNNIANSTIYYLDSTQSLYQQSCGGVNHPMLFTTSGKVKQLLLANLDEGDEKEFLLIDSLGLKVFGLDRHKIFSRSSGNHLKIDIKSANKTQYIVLTDLNIKESIVLTSLGQETHYQPIKHSSSILVIDTNMDGKLEVVFVNEHSTLECIELF